MNKPKLIKTTRRSVQTQIPLDKTSPKIPLYKVKNSKITPLQTRCSTDGSRKLRFPDYVTMAQDGSKVVSITRRPYLPPENTPVTHFC